MLGLLVLFWWILSDTLRIGNLTWRLGYCGYQDHSSMCLWCCFVSHGAYLVEGQCGSGLLLRFYFWYWEGLLSDRQDIRAGLLWRKAWLCLGWVTVRLMSGHSIPGAENRLAYIQADVVWPLKVNTCTEAAIAYMRATFTFGHSSSVGANRVYICARVNAIHLS